jgi:hypothetical protein
MKKQETLLVWTNILNENHNESDSPCGSTSLGLDSGSPTARIYSLPESGAAFASAEMLLAWPLVRRLAQLEIGYIEQGPQMERDGMHEADLKLDAFVRLVRLIRRHFSYRSANTPRSLIVPVRHNLLRGRGFVVRRVLRNRAICKVV